MIYEYGRDFLDITHEGAEVTQWAPRGQDILYPSRVCRIKDGPKRHGGIPVCLPNFSTPSTESEFSDLPKHGFMRNLPYRLRDGQVVTVEARQRMSYEGYAAHPWEAEVEVFVQLAGCRLAHNVCVQRQDGLSHLMPLGLGIHPYFNSPQGSVVFVGSEQINPEGGYGPKFYPTPEGPIRIRLVSLGEVVMRLSKGYKEEGAGVIVWSDSDDYICVEPVVRRPKCFGTKSGRYLDNGQAITAYCDLDFRPE